MSIVSRGNELYLGSDPVDRDDYDPALGVPRDAPPVSSADVRRKHQRAGGIGRRENPFVAERFDHRSTGG
jgi:hypothetical protein